MPSKTDKEAKRNALTPPKLEGWNCLIREIELPTALAAAVMTGRPQLIPLAKDLPADEVNLCYDLIGCLIETNRALQLHAAKLAQLAEQVQDHLTGLRHKTMELEAYADFREPDSEDEE